MIYTITLNPALDVVMHLEDSLKSGKLNRARNEMISSGGKGINVSRVLKTLKRDSIALGLVGGFIGKHLEDILKEEGIKTDFAHIVGNTRLNIKIATNGKEKTEINAPGPNINKEDIMSLAKKLAKVKKEDIVVISGALPKSLSLNLFENFLKYLSTNQTHLALDISGKALLQALKYRPYLVKINLAEINETLYTNCKNKEEIINAAKRLIKMGAMNVIVTLGKDGAIFVNNCMELYFSAPKITVKNSTGAGDSFLAGFIDEFLKTENIEKSLRKALIVGAATAACYDLADEKTIKEITKLME